MTTATIAQIETTLELAIELDLDAILAVELETGLASDIDNPI